jgi:DNA-binding LacI/PurR family transcriptional regulator
LQIAVNNTMPSATLSKNRSRLRTARTGAVTLADVARRAGVDISTVSRTLNGAPGTVPVKAKTRQIVEQAAKELGYAPNAAARALAAGRTNIIGVVCYDITDPLVPHLLTAVETEAEKLGYRLFICATYNGPAQEADQGDAYVSLLHERRVDAILVLGERIIEAEGYLNDCPKVLFASVAGVTRKGTVCTAGLDYFGAGIEAGKHLASLGHREVAFLKGAHSCKSVEIREAGLREGLKKSGATLITVGEELEVPFDQAGHACITTILANHPEVTAAVSRNDMMALGALRALQEAGVRVPDQFSLLSWGNAYFSSLTYPALTAVDVPIKEAGCNLLTELMKILKDPSSPPQHMTLPMKLVVRESTGPARKDI